MYLFDPKFSTWNLYTAALFPALITLSLWRPRSIGLIFLQAAFKIEIMKYGCLIVWGFLAVMLSPKQFQQELSKPIFIDIVIIFAIVVILLELRKDKNKAVFEGQSKSKGWKPVAAMLLILILIVPILPQLEYNVRMNAMAKGLNLTIKAYKFGNGVSNFAYSPDGRYLSVVQITYKGLEVDILEAETRTVVQRFRASGKVTCIAFSPDGRYLVTGIHTEPADPRQIGFEVWDVSTGEKVDKFRIPDTFQRKIRAGDKMNEVYILKFSPDGHYLAIRDGYATEIWDFQEGMPVTADGGYIWIDNKRYFKTTRDSAPVVVEMESGKEESKNNISRNEWVEEISANPNGKHAAFIVGGNTRAEVWDIEEEKKLYTLVLDDGEKLESITYSPDGKLLVTGDYNGNKIKLWDATTGAPIRIMQHPEAKIEQLAFRHDGKRLIAASLNIIALFDIE